MQTSIFLSNIMQRSKEIKSYYKYKIKQYYQKGDIFAYDYLAKNVLIKKDFMFRFEKFWIQDI